MGQWDRVFSPSLINEFRAHLSFEDRPREANSRTAPETLIFGDFGTTGQNNFLPNDLDEYRLQFSDNLSWISGRHSVKMGVDFNYIFHRNTFFRFRGGQYRYSSFRNFLRQSVLDFTQAFSDFEGRVDMNGYDLAGFVQDAWKITPQFTLSLGLRYDLQLHQQPETFDRAIPLTDRVPKDRNNFGPRMGFAWSPFSGGRTVVRGGYGVFFARTPQLLMANALLANGQRVVRVFLRGSQSPVYPTRFSSLEEALQFSGGGVATPEIFAVDPDYVNPYIQQASLTLGRELSRNWALEAGYLFTKGTHLQRNLEGNLAPAQSGRAITLNGFDSYGLPTGSVVTVPDYNFRRVYSNITRMTLIASNVDSNYHGMILKLSKRFSDGFQMLASYTLSKAIDTGANDRSVSSGSTPSDSFNVAAERGLAETDQRHRLVLSAIWEPSFQEVGNPALRGFLQGFQFSGIGTFGSGRPVDAEVSGDVNRDGRTTDRLPGMGRNTFTGPDFQRIDFRISRRFSLADGASVQLLLEAFNLLNRANFGGTNRIIGRLSGTVITADPAFLTHRSAFNPRIFQLGVRMAF